MEVKLGSVSAKPNPLNASLQGGGFTTKKNVRVGLFGTAGQETSAAVSESEGTTFTVTLGNYRNVSYADEGQKIRKPFFKKSNGNPSRDGGNQRKPRQNGGNGNRIRKEVTTDDLDADMDAYLSGK